MTTEFDPRITAYFGDAVLRVGFMAIPHLFMRHYRAIGLNTSQAMFLMQIMESTWDLGDPPKTSGDLARRMGVDKRTIRKYSEEIEKLGLLILYDQFDQHGAQVENGYDLSPLFKCLAQFAPEPSPAGSFRRRQARTSIVSGEGQNTDSTPPPDRTIRPSPGSNNPPRPVDRTILGRVDQAIHDPGIVRSGLKRKPRISKNQEICMMYDAGAVVSNEATAIVVDAKSHGYSLRRQHSLTPSDVRMSDELLQRAGIDNPVRACIAPTLAPGEVWLLRAYAVAKHWSVPLVISHVYDKSTKQPRAASSVLTCHDPVGDQLGALESDLAEHVLACVAAHYPDAPSAVRADLKIASSAAACIAAIGLWAMVAELRGKLNGALTWDDGVVFPSTGHVPGAEHGTIWNGVQDDLERKIPADEFAVWLKDTMLLELDDRQAIVGTANVFARDVIVEHYVEVISGVLETRLQRPIDVQVVVGR